jgi:hypothetical protein
MVSMLEVEAVLQNCIPLSPNWCDYCFVYETFVACGELRFKMTCKEGLLMYLSRR